MKLTSSFLAFSIVLTTAIHAGGNGDILTESIGTFSSPVGIYHAGDDRLFIVEQNGTIRIVDNGSTLATPFLDISNLTNGGGERGLLGLAFHPDYETNGFFYVNYTKSSDGATVIARFEASSDPNIADTTSRETLLEIDQDFSNHNGGQIQFGPDGFLYIGMGDGGSGGDPNCRAQNDDTLLGKMLRLDVDQNTNTAPFYGIPADNPYVGAGDPLDEIWAKGLRNPWRFSFDRMTGDLWVADVGQQQFEEVNFIEAGTAGGINFGWDVKEGFSNFGQTTGNCQPDYPSPGDPSLTDPVHVYDHSGGRCSITGGYVYRGNSAPDLYGKYLFADFCSRDLYALSFEDNDDVVVESLMQLSGNIRSFGEGNDGELYVTDGNRVVRLFQEVPSSVTGWSIQ